MMLYKIVSGVWWGVWAMIQHTVSKIEFDYMAWGLERASAAPGSSSTTPTIPPGWPAPDELRHEHRDPRVARGSAPGLACRASRRGLMGHDGNVMSSRPPQSRPDRLPSFGQGSGFMAGLVAIARLGLLAILFFGALNVLVSLFDGPSVSRTAGATQG